MLRKMRMLCTVTDQCDCREFILVSTAATYSMLPLLYRQEESATKLLLLALHVSCVWLVLGGQTQNTASDRAIKQAAPEMKLSVTTALVHAPELFTAGLVVLEVYCSGIHAFMFGDRLSFLPLMLTSLYCSIGMLIVWVGMAVEYCLGQ